jgi:hypothetical protein
MADEPSAITQDSPMGRLIEAAKRNEEAATRHLAAVGDVATRWAGFELSIDIAAINLAELKYPITFVFYGAGDWVRKETRRIHICRALAWHRHLLDKGT